MFEQILAFALNHWIMSGLLLVITVLLIVDLLRPDTGSVDPTGATELINRKDALVVDVRPIVDFEQGHIIGATNLPSNGFANQIGLLEKHRERPIIVYCRSGAQSAQACGQLRKRGFAQVFNLRGGVMAWQNAGLPLHRK